MSHPNRYTVTPLTPTQKLIIRCAWQAKKTRSGKPQLKDLAEVFQRSPHTIRNIIRGHRYPTE